MTANTYDFVIAGGGTAGLVLARRLSEGGKFTVCVLEAGAVLEANRPDVAMTIMVPSLIAKGEVVWPYQTNSQKQFGGRQIPLPAGRAAGGSSNINYSVWTRGNATDYDRLAEISGDSSWKFEALLPYFKKTETYHYPSESNGRSALHGESGPVHVVPFSVTNRQWKWHDHILEAYKSAGFRWIDDINEGATLGYGELAYTDCFSLGGRQTSATYLIDKPAGLQVLGGKTVAKILFDGVRAIGATTVSGEAYHARKEVLVCAGALRSPAILQLSGVGPKDLLASLGIPLVVDSPGVGENFWDHPIVPMRWRIKEAARGGTLDDIRQPDKLRSEMDLYKTKGIGIMGGAPFEVTGWKNHSDECGDIIKSDPALSEKTKDHLSSPTTPHSQYLLTHGYAFRGTLDLGAESYLSISPSLVTPTSRGSIRISSADPNVLPTFDPQYLATATDQALMKAALKVGGNIMQSPVWKDVFQEEANLEENVAGFSDEMLDQKLKDSTVTTYHYAGTCAMAASDCKEVIPVVDSKCQVYGVTGLRVVDMSVFSTPISANTQAPTYVLGEKIAHEILERYLA